MADIQAELRESGTLLHVTFGSSKGNILTGALMTALRTELARHATSLHLRAVVLQGAGGTFSFGASVEEHKKEQAPAMLKTLNALVRDVALFPVPVVALVEGRCLGGAFELALACHLMFVTPEAQLGCPEIKLGVFPPVLAALGPVRMPGALCERMILTGESITGAEAKAVGLAANVVPKDAPLDSVLAWYREGVAKTSAAALRTSCLASRRNVRDAVANTLDQLTALYEDRVLGSHDGNEGIEAFLARRTPNWKDA